MKRKKGLTHYTETSMAQTLLSRLLGLIQTTFGVPRQYFNCSYTIQYKMYIYCHKYKQLIISSE